LSSSETSTDALAPSGPAIDEAGILRMVGGNRSLLSGMVALFLQDYPKRVAEIAVALDRNDAEGLEFAAHSVKGAALTLCAGRVAESALSIVKRARAADLHLAGAALVALERELAHAHAGLAQFTTA
jgi:HPt (histidine-containing phosphotransfer) domain-containing protein